MRKPHFSFLVITACLILGCGQSDQSQAVSESPKPPGMAVPTHVLTPGQEDTTLEVEAGDRIEVQLPEPDDGSRWVQQADADLVRLGSPEGKVRQTKTGPVRVFRFQTAGAGETTLSFALVGPEGERLRVETFTISTL